MKIELTPYDIGCITAIVLNYKERIEHDSYAKLHVEKLLRKLMAIAEEYYKEDKSE